MNEETKKFVEYVYDVKNLFLIHRQIAVDAKSQESLHAVFDEIIDFLESLAKTCSKNSPTINYLNQFKGIIDSMTQQLPYSNQSNNNFVFGNERGVIETLFLTIQNIKSQFEALVFKFNFFEKLSFFKSNIIIVGANGSGKTSVSNKLKEFTSDNDIVISAQRILLIPNFHTISSPNATQNDLKRIQKIDKTNKEEHSFSQLHDEFQILLKNLVAENIFLSNEHRKNAVKLSESELEIPKPEKSKLDLTFEIWNSLIEHREIDCTDGMNITVHFNEERYPAIKMSDGEKAILFLISQVLQAPVDGFIIIDEPEMYIHKTILSKLWDKLESQRQDCIFIYLTHDLDFATSRVTAKKIWIKSFIHPDKWDMESIPENEQLPESLMMELLGSRKTILFCEGEKGKLDEKIYNILFPNYTISPVGGCFEVINHTKAFNKIPNTNIKAIGLIDSDHHPSERLSKLKTRSVYSFKVAEVENLLLDEDFLKKLAEKVFVDPQIISNIKSDVIEKLDNQKEIQASNFISARIDYYFKDSNVKKGNAAKDLKSNFIKFIDEVKIDEFYDERINELNTIISAQDYVKAISVYNNKSIGQLVEKHFKISDFTDRAITLLQFDNATHDILLKYFPDELKSDFK